MRLRSLEASSSAEIFKMIQDVWRDIRIIGGLTELVTAHTGRTTVNARWPVQDVRESAPI